MTKPKFGKRDPKKVQQATLCFLIKKNEDQIDEVLLAMKKRGFGEGLWNGVGGKVSSKEFFEEAAKRETQEEIEVEPKDLEKIALLHFYFPDDPDKKDWNQDVHVFFATDWTGEPQESEEMKPRWFTVSKLPYNSMWDDDHLWFPRVLEGEKIEAWFSFGADNKVIAHKIDKRVFSAEGLKKD